MTARGHTQLLLADTRRALAWERGLIRAGFSAQRVEARGRDADRADWAISVPDAEAVAARRYVSDVLGGRARLPHVAIISRSGAIALAGAVLVLAALIVAAVIGR